MADFQEALKEVEPSAMREVLVEVPDVKWDDIGGLNGVKEELKEAVEWPLKYSDVFTQLNATPPKGLLLYGPPGTGKTLLAKAVANESQANFISVKGPELVISQFLTELDGLEELRNVVVIAATNRPDIIDQALLRPGRFDRLLYVPPPDLEARKQIFRIRTKKTPLDEDVELDGLARRTDGYTGADIASVCNTAMMSALRELIGKAKDAEDAKKKAKGLKVTGKHFDEALQKIKPISSQELRMYERFSQQFSEAGKPGRQKPLSAIG